MRGVGACLSVDLNEARPQCADARQQPSFLYFPELPASAYLDRALFPWLADLEAQTSRIRAELLALLPSDRGRERVVTTYALEQLHLRALDQPPSWHGYHFFRPGYPP